MNTRGKLQVYTFAVTLIETITVKARNEEKARAVLRPSPAPLFHGPYRSVDYEEKERILRQELRQEQVELLSVEDDPLVHPRALNAGVAKHHLDDPKGPAPDFPNQRNC